MQVELIDRINLSELEEIADECNGEVYPNYSGRFMYGRKCFGISGSDPIEIIECAARHGLHSARYDSLGRDSIVYWPELRVNDDYEDHSYYDKLEEEME
jgi:hypothetical protein